MKTLRMALVVGLALVGAAGCMMVPGAERVFEGSYSVVSGAQLTVTTDAGSIDIRGWSGNTVEVTAYIRDTSVFLPSIDLNEVDIVVDTSSDITMWAEPDNLSGISVSYEILVPPQVVVQRVRSATGSIDLVGVAVDGSVQTGTGSVNLTRVGGYPVVVAQTGSITVRDSDGVTSATTSTGSIEVEFVSFPSVTRIPILTSTGSVTVRLAGPLSADVDADTDTGSVTIGDDLAFSGTQTNHAASGTIGGGGPVLDVDTNTGSITFSRL